MTRPEFTAQRRRAIRAMAFVVIVEIAMLTGAYFTSAGLRRSFIEVVGPILLGISLLLIGALIAVYHQISKKIDNE